MLFFLGKLEVIKKAEIDPLRHRNKLLYKN